MILKIILTAIAVYCFVHAVRDYMQWKYGYNNWFTSFGHNLWPFKDVPRKYELVGMVVSIVVGIILFLEEIE